MSSPNVVEVSPIDSIYQLTPSVNEHWLLSKNGTAIDKLLVDFQDYNNPAMQKYAELTEPFQQALVVIEINKNLSDDWSFYGNGIEYIQALDNCNYNLISKVSADKKALILKITNVGKTNSFNPNPNDNLDNVIEVETVNPQLGLEVKFRYIAQFVDPTSATQKIIMSQDPGMIIRRPPNPM